MSDSVAVQIGGVSYSIALPMPFDQLKKAQPVVKALRVGEDDDISLMGLCLRFLAFCLVKTNQAEIVEMAEKFEKAVQPGEWRGVFDSVPAILTASMPQKEKAQGEAEPPAPAA